MSEHLPQEFWQGVEQFNSEQFYACHDTLEALWIEATEPEKTLYQGILQIAVALYHLGNGNLRGAMILLGEGTNRLRRYPDNECGIEVDKLLIESVEFLKTLQQADVQKIAHSDLMENLALPLPKISIIKE
jgi:predicted metal-dependent hydrolase